MPVNHEASRKSCPKLQQVHSSRVVGTTKRANRFLHCIGATHQRESRCLSLVLRLSCIVSHHRKRRLGHLIEPVTGRRLTCGSRTNAHTSGVCCSLGVEAVGMKSYLFCLTTKYLRSNSKIPGCRGAACHFTSCFRRRLGALQRTIDLRGKAATTGRNSSSCWVLRWTQSENRVVACPSNKWWRQKRCRLPLRVIQRKKTRRSPGLC